MSILFYRENALRSSLSPQQLDVPMRIVGVWSWALLSGACLALVTALIWGVTGRIPTRVAGQGILTGDPHAMHTISALYGGDLLDVSISPGDRVERGQIIARVAQPELEQRFDEMTRNLALLIEQQRSLERYYADSLTRFRDAAAAQRDVIAKLTEDPATDRSVAAQIQLQQALAARQKITADELDQSRLRDAALRDFDLKIADMAERLAQAKTSLDLATVITSPAAGRIVALNVRPYTKLAAGTQIASLAPEDQPMETVIFVSARDAKSIATGLRVDVIPASVRTEEFGAIVGHVIEVGMAPETGSSMMRLLGNEILVRQFSTAGAPFIVRVKLLKDPRTPTGFRWTSGTGPDARFAGKLSFGTPLAAQITVREQAPITLVVPMLKRSFGLHP